MRNSRFLRFAIWSYPEVFERRQRMRRVMRRLIYLRIRAVVEQEQKRLTA